MEQSIILFADFNNTDTDGRVRLNTVGTLNDLERLNIRFKKGLKVLLDDKSQLKAAAVVEFSEKEKIWVAKINWDNIVQY